jgi:hypothetical protein
MIWQTVCTGDRRDERELTWGENGGEDGRWTTRDLQWRAVELCEHRREEISDLNWERRRSEAWRGRRGVANLTALTMMTKRSNLTTPSLTVAARVLRWLELDGEGDGSRFGLRWRRWSTRLFMRGSNVRSKPRRRSRDRDGLHRASPARLRAWRRRRRRLTRGTASSVRQRKKTERGEKRACGFGMMGLGELGSAHSRDCERRGGAGFGPTKEMARLGQREELGGNWALGPNWERNYLFFLFSFLTLQIHFQIILEIIFLWK